jgi:hypothetical protein
MSIAEKTLATATSRFVLGKLRALDEAVKDKRTEADEIMAGLPALVASRPNGELAGTFERRKLNTIKTEIAELELLRPALNQLLIEARARECHETFTEKHSRCLERSAAHQAAAAEFQACAESYARAFVRMQETDQRFVESLHDAGTVSDVGNLTEYYAALPNRAGLALFVASGGRLRARGIFESPEQLRERGWHDLRIAASDHCKVALRALIPPAGSNFHPTEPPRAA